MRESKEPCCLVDILPMGRCETACVCGEWTNHAEGCKCVAPMCEHRAANTHVAIVSNPSPQGDPLSGANAAGRNANDDTPGLSAATISTETLREWAKDGPTARVYAPSFPTEAERKMARELLVYRNMVSVMVGPDPDRPEK